MFSFCLRSLGANLVSILFKIYKKVAGVSPLILQNPYLCWAHSRNRSVPSNYSFSYILALRFEVTSGLFSSVTVIKSISSFLFLYCMIVLLCGTRKSIGSIVISRNNTRINCRQITRHLSSRTVSRAQFSRSFKQLIVSL